MGYFSRNVERKKNHIATLKKKKSVLKTTNGFTTSIHIISFCNNFVVINYVLCGCNHQLVFRKIIQFKED